MFSIVYLYCIKYCRNAAAGLVKSYVAYFLTLRKARKTMVCCCNKRLYVPSNCPPMPFNAAESDMRRATRRANSVAYSGFSTRSFRGARINELCAIVCASLICPYTLGVKKTTPEISGACIHLKSTPSDLSTTWSSISPSGGAFVVDAILLNLSVEKAETCIKNLYPGSSRTLAVRTSRSCNCSTVVSSRSFSTRSETAAFFSFSSNPLSSTRTSVSFFCKPSEGAKCTVCSSQLFMPLCHRMASLYRSNPHELVDSLIVSVRPFS